MERRRLSLLALRPDNKPDDGGNESVMLSDESRKIACGQRREFARYRILGKKPNKDDNKLAQRNTALCRQNDGLGQAGAKEGFQGGGN